MREYKAGIGGLTADPVYGMSGERPTFLCRRLIAVRGSAELQILLRRTLGGPK